MHYSSDGNQEWGLEGTSLGAPLLVGIMVLLLLEAALSVKYQAALVRTSRLSGEFCAPC